MNAGSDFTIAMPKRSEVDDIMEIMNLSFQDEFAVTGFDPQKIRKMAKFMLSPLGRFLLYIYKVGAGTEILAYLGKEKRVPVSFAMMTLRKSRGYISSVAVHPGHRRQGYARRTLARAIDDAKGRAGQLVLHVSVVNPSAKNLYLSVGFERFETLLTMVHEDVSILKEPIKSDRPVIREARSSDKKRIFELLKSSHSPDHQKITPVHISDMGLSAFMGGKSKTFVHVIDGRLIGTATCSIPKGSMPTSIRRVAILNDIEPSMRADIVKALVHACASWSSQFRAGKCLLNIELWEGTMDIVQVLNTLGFSEGLRMDGMRLDLLENLSGPKAP